jgi:hypothetical protein
MSVDIVIDPGHGGTEEPGAVGPTGLKEKDVNLRLALLTADILWLNKVTFLFTRTTDETVSIGARSGLANTTGAKFFLSFHKNSNVGAPATGTETWAFAPNTGGDRFAKNIQRHLVSAIGLRDRGVKYSGNNFGVLRDTRMPAALIETAFINNPREEALLRDDGFLKAAAKGIAFGVMESLGRPMFGVDIPAEPPKPTGTPIIGKSILAPNQLAGFLLSKEPNPLLNCTPLELAQHFISEGAIEGVRGDIAFCQAIHETGWFRFKGDVQPDQNNYGGIGAVGGGAGGNRFASPQIGVRGLIHHLVAYATTRDPFNSVESPRFHLVNRGIAPTFEQLGGYWAVPGYDRARFDSFGEAFAAGATYGQKIVQLYGEMVAFTGTLPEQPEPPKEPEHWAEPSYDYLNSHGVKVVEKRFDEPPTRGEMIVLAARVLERCKE